MKKWYCVKTVVEMDKVRAKIAAIVEKDEVPVSSYKKDKYGDVYEDWFGSQREAESWIGKLTETGL